MKKQRPFQVRCKYILRTSNSQLHLSQNTKTNRISSRGSFSFNMVFPHVIAAFHTLLDAIGLPGNLLVIVTIALERRFHVMRYILLASLAVSDFLFLILVNSFRIASIAQERWLYGETMCRLNPFFARYFYLNTVLHLVAVSYERYSAIVKSPLTYTGTITKSRVVFIVLIWIIPIPLSIGPFFGFAGRYDYNAEVFYCEQGWSVQSAASGRNTMLSSIASFVLLLLVILFLNWSVYKTAKSQINALEVQVGSLAGSESKQQEISKKKKERRAAADITIIICAFLLCFLPGYIVGLLRQFVKSIQVPAAVVSVTSCIFIASSICNPIIYSIRKREFRTGVKNLLKRVGLFENSTHIANDSIAMNNLRIGANLATSTPAAAQVNQYQDERLFGIPPRVGVNFQKRCLSPIPEVVEELD